MFRTADKNRDKPPFKVGDVVVKYNDEHNEHQKELKICEIKFHSGYIEWSIKIDDQYYFTNFFKLVKSAINCTLCNDTGNSGFMYVIKCGCGQ